MITLFAAITGFISSIIPEILKIYKDINDKKTRDKYFRSSNCQ